MSIFEPTDQTKAILKRLNNVSNLDKMLTEFFDLWETEGEYDDAPRRAASVVAHRYVRLAARIAVFGAVCAGKEPDLKLWNELCRIHGENALVDVKEAFKDGPAEA